MTLDPTARRANIKDSIKRWAVADIETATRPVTFEKWLSIPDIVGGAEKWVSFNLGPVDRGVLSDIVLEILCCTRKDSEGFKLAQLTDNVMEQLTDTTMSDGMKRIPFYKSALLLADWVLIGGIMVQDVKESGEMESSDATKYIILTCRLRTASKI